MSRKSYDMEIIEVPSFERLGMNASVLGTSPCPGYLYDATSGLALCLNMFPDVAGVRSACIRLTTEYFLALELVMAGHDSPCPHFNHPKRTEPLPMNNQTAGQLSRAKRANRNLQ